MRTESMGKETAAAARISKPVAEAVVDLVTQEGAALEKTLASLRIVTHAESTLHRVVDIDKVGYYVAKHCCVMCGHYPRAYWPRVHSRSGAIGNVLLCTCKWFSQHACCEHVYYVSQIRGEPPNSCMRVTEPPGLDVLPLERKTRRKRKKILFLFQKSKLGNAFPFPTLWCSRRCRPHRYRFLGR